MTNEERQSKLDQLASVGLLISMVYGSRGATGIGWSVNVLNPGTGAFPKPKAANSIDHCVEIAEIEAAKRGWLR